MRIIGTIFSFIFLFLINIAIVSSHSFILTSISTNLTINWSEIDSKTIVSLPYNIEWIKTDEDRKLINQSNLEYLNQSFFIANKGDLCKFEATIVSPDEDNLINTIIDSKITCKEDIESIDDLTIKSQLFQDVSWFEWTHFISLTNWNIKKDIALTFEDNIYPYTIESINISKNWDYYILIWETEVGNWITEDVYEWVKNFDENINQGKWFFNIIKQFIIIWIEHILIWTDHILFVVCLVLLLVSIKDILKLTITFTIAHSITLILASLSIVSLTWKIVEPIIALSIIYLAIDNFLILRWNKQNNIKINKKIFITFLFWLFHWLGFAWVLSEINIPKDYFLTSLISFNIGVELWQIFIVFIILLPILYIIKKYSWKNIAMQILSILISIIATFWFIERVFL